MAIQSDHEFAPTQIARAVFPTAFRGYDQDAVRRYLSRLAAALEHQQEYAGLGELEARTPAHERVSELEVEVESLRDEIKDLELELVQRSVDGGPGTEGGAADGENRTNEAAVAFDEHRAIELLGQETARVLESARSAAADILKRAETQAATLKAQAKAELVDARKRVEKLAAERQAETHDLVEQLTAEAEANANRLALEADEHRAAVLEESAKILAEAEQKAGSEQAVAEQRAKQVVADAETLRQQVISELVVERRQAQGEMNRMIAARDRLAMSLAVARSELDEVADALVDVSTAAMDTDQADVEFAGHRVIDTDADPDAAADVSVDADADDPVDVDDGPTVDTTTASSRDRATAPETDREPAPAPEAETEPKPQAEVVAQELDLREPEPAEGPGTGSTDSPRSKKSEGGGGAKADDDTAAKPRRGGRKKSANNGSVHKETAMAAAVTTAEIEPDEIGVPTGGGTATTTAEQAESGPAVEAEESDMVIDLDIDSDPDSGVEPETDSELDLDSEMEIDEIELDSRFDVDSIIDLDADNELPADGGALSLVEGFTTIEIPDTKNDGADSSVSADEAVAAAADSREHSAGGSPHPDEVITTVASRTALSQPDRTRGDLPLNGNFGGRVPKEFAARDVALTQSGPNFRRQLRRALNDDQSEVLDRLRAGRGDLKVDELPEFADQIDRYLAPLRRGLAEIAQAGARAGGRSDLSQAALDNLVRQLAKYIVDKVRIPTIGVLQETVDQDRERILEPIRTLYRDFRNVGLSDLTEDALYEAFAIGLYDSIEEGAHIRWVTDPRTDPDPVCEINRGREDIIKGEVFPSGHARPLSLPGCRCLVTTDR